MTINPFDPRVVKLMKTSGLDSFAIGADMSSIRPRGDRISSEDSKVTAMNALKMYDNLAQSLQPVPTKPKNRRERRLAQFGPTYKYRGLPCSIQPDDKLWCVSGREKNGGGGILEYCYDEADARDRLNIMSKYPQFEYLEATAFLDPNSMMQKFNAQLRKNAERKDK